MMTCISDGWMIPLGNTVFLHSIGSRRSICLSTCPCAMLSSFVISHQSDIRTKFLSSLTSINLSSSRSLDWLVYRISHTRRRGRAIDGPILALTLHGQSKPHCPEINSLNPPDGHAVGFLALSTNIFGTNMTTVLLALGGDSS